MRTLSSRNTLIRVVKCGLTPLSPDIRLEADVALHVVVAAPEEALDVVGVAPGGHHRLVQQDRAPGAVRPVRDCFRCPRGRSETCNFLKSVMLGRTECFSYQLIDI